MSARQAEDVDATERIAALVNLLGDLAAEREIATAAAAAAAVRIERLTAQRMEVAARADAAAARLAELEAETEALRAFARRLRTTIDCDNTERSRLLGERDDARSLAIAMRDELDADRGRATVLNARVGMHRVGAVS